MRKADTFTCEGDVRGMCGVAHRTPVAALKHIQVDHKGCRAQGGYTDRFPVWWHPNGETSWIEVGEWS
jgi:hypothetical protein